MFFHAGIIFSKDITSPLISPVYLRADVVYRMVMIPDISREYFCPKLKYMPSRNKNSVKVIQLTLWTAFFFSIMIITFMATHPHFLAVR